VYVNLKFSDSYIWSVSNKQLSALLVQCFS